MDLAAVVGADPVAIKASRVITCVVTVEVVAERVDEFLKVMEVDAIGSLTLENGGCLRFDVLQVRDKPNNYIFYEAYRDEEALLAHRNFPHFQPWNAFKESGGVVSASKVLADGVYFG